MFLVPRLKIPTGDENREPTYWELEDKERGRGEGREGSGRRIRRGERREADQGASREANGIRGEE